jgi:hypothetical protein
MTETYSDILIETIKNGYDGSWERLIAKRLERDAMNGHSQAELILASNDYDALNGAKQILLSKTPEQ